MKRLFITTGLLAITFTLSLVVATAPAAHAQETNASGQALEIAPPVIMLTADPGQEIKTEISLRDVSTSPLIVTSTVNDFSSGDNEDGAPQIDVDQKEQSPYSIISWVSPLPQLTLQPKQIEKLPITIRVPSNAAPGGYYGTIRFSAVPPDMNDTGVSLSASLGALVFIRINGDAKESMEIVEFYAQKEGKKGWMFESQPLSFAQRIKNTGNVHEQPKSTVLVKDMFGNNVANLNMNLEARNVLPGSVRRFTTSMDKAAIGDRVLFGLYSAKITTAYGTKGQTLTKDISFWVIPWGLILVTLAGVAVLVAIAITLIRRSADRLVRKSRGTRRR